MSANWKTACGAALRILLCIFNDPITVHFSYLQDFQVSWLFVSPLSVDVLGEPLAQIHGEFFLDQVERFQPFSTIDSVLIFDR